MVSTMSLSPLSVRRLCLYLIFVLSISPSICEGLIIPSTPWNSITGMRAMRPTLAVTMESQRNLRRDAPVISTMPALWDDDSAADAEILPIEQVLATLIKEESASPMFAAPAATPALASSAGISGAEAASPTETAISPTASPPKQGPGIVLISTPLTGTAAIPTNTAGAKADNTAGGGVSSSNRVLILGCIVGGIIFVALILFFLLDPSLSRTLCGFCRPRRVKQSKADKGISSLNNASVARSRRVPVPNERSFIGMHTRKAIPTYEKRGQSALVEVDLNAPPRSKFSVCSSDYLSASTRDSGVTATSISVSTRPARPSVVTFASPSTTPARPPRPPTADSPALTDSVYLACEKQPYVLAAQPRGKADGNGPPKKNLTPSEFFAMHVPAILSSLVGNTRPEGVSRSDRTVSAIAKRSSGSSGRSQHSRTKSMPLLSMKRASRFPTKLVGGIEDDSLRKKVLKHRRSRSASGWAYPDRQRVKKVVNA